MTGCKNLRTNFELLIIERESLFRVGVATLGDEEKVLRGGKAHSLSPFIRQKEEKSSFCRSR